MNNSKILKILTGTLITAFVLAFSLYLRWNAFWLPHWKGDQNQYLALAMKLEKQGLKGYNLREVRLGNQRQDKIYPPTELVFFKLGSPGSEGDLLKIMKIVGQGFYDEPLHMRAPLFPFCLMLSHKIFMKDNPVYIVSNSILGEDVKKYKPDFIFKEQFWAAFVPLIFNLAVILTTLFLGTFLFNGRVGLWASLIIATNPVSLMTAHRVLAEDAMVFFILLSAGLFLKFFLKKNWIGIFLSGASLGLAVLSKQNALLMLPITWCVTILADEEKKLNPKALALRLLNPAILIYGLGVLAVTAFWFWEVYSVYGNPFYQPFEGWARALDTDKTGWFRALRERPAPTLFFTINLLTICPIFILSFFSLKKAYGYASDAPVRRPEALYFVYLWVWVLFFYLWLAQPWRILEMELNQEHRYFYAAYPALALLAAWALDTIRLKLKKYASWPFSAEILVWSILILNAWRSVPLGLKIVYSNQMLF